MSENRIDAMLEHIKKKAIEEAAKFGFELADDFDQQLARWGEYLREPVEYKEPSEPLPTVYGQQWVRPTLILNDDATTPETVSTMKILGEGEWVEMEPLQWTSEFPTKEGVYWIRNYTRRSKNLRLVKGPEIVHVINFALDPEVGLRAWRVGKKWPLVRSDVISAEWYGPIEPPE